MQKLIDSAPRSSAHPKSQRRVVLTSFDAIIDAVSLAFGEPEESIRIRSQRPARKAIALLGSEKAGLTFVAIGAWLGITSEAASYLTRRARVLEQSDDEFASRLRQARLHLGIDHPPF